MLFLAFIGLGSTPALRAAEPLAYGALTLAPTQAWPQVDWLARAETISPHAEQDETIRQAVLRHMGAAVPRAEEVRPGDIPAILALAPETPGREENAEVEAAAPRVESGTPATPMPDTGLTRFAQGYENNVPTTTAAVQSLDAPARVTGPTIEDSPRPAAAGLTPSLLPTRPAVPADRTRARPETATPALAFGSAADLAATAPARVQAVVPQVAVQTGLPAGYTLYASELTGLITSATGTGGTMATYKTINASDALAGITSYGGSLFVVDQNAGIIDRVVTSTGAVSTFANVGTSVAPNALAADASGNVYVTLSNNTIDKITPGGSVGLFATLPSTGTLQGLAFIGTDLYASNPGLRTISKITSGGTVSTFVTFASGTYPTALNLSGLAADKSGNLYVADAESANGNIYKVTSGGVISIYASVGSNQEPLGLAFDPNGVLYSANAASVSQITTAGVASTFATDSNGPLYLVVVPEPGTFLGGALLLGVAGVGWHRRRS